MQLTFKKEERRIKNRHMLLFLNFLDLLLSWVWGRDSLHTHAFIHCAIHCFQMKNRFKLGRNLIRIYF